MRGADTFTEGQFTMRHLEGFVPSDHPLWSLRQVVNDAFLKMDGLFAGMNEYDVKGGLPSIAPEKLLRAMLLQLFCSVSSDASSWRIPSPACCFDEHSWLGLGTIPYWSPP